MVQLHRTCLNERCVEGFHIGLGWLDYSSCIFAVGTRYLYTSSGWFNCTEPPQIAQCKCVVVCPMGLGLFDYSEPSPLTPSSQGEQGVEGNCTLPNTSLDPGYPRRVSVETARKWHHDVGFYVLQMCAQMLWSQGKSFSGK